MSLELYIGACIDEEGEIQMGVVEAHNFDEAKHEWARNIRSFAGGEATPLPKDDADFYPHIKKEYGCHTFTAMPVEVDVEINLSEREE